MTDALTAVVWLAGSAFALLAAVGVLRMPDVFTRMQASTKASTLGLACLLIGTAVQMGDLATLVRTASIGAFMLLPLAEIAKYRKTASEIVDRVKLDDGPES